MIEGIQYIHQDSNSCEKSEMCDEEEIFLSWSAILIRVFYHTYQLQRQHFESKKPMMISKQNPPH